MNVNGFNSLANSMANNLFSQAFPGNAANQSFANGLANFAANGFGPLNNAMQAFQGMMQGVQGMPMMNAGANFPQMPAGANQMMGMGLPQQGGMSSQLAPAASAL
ncbi:MAG TPA: hypothetical protein DCE42_07505, partial [Myxococcales bacterium]|nr:hypothetical protein [Myxococcales bacterium]